MGESVDKSLEEKYLGAFFIFPGFPSDPLARPVVT